MNELSTKAVKAIGQWICMRDTGVSSQTMAAIAMGAKRQKGVDFDAPHDPSDFGRCYRLVKVVPDIRMHFDRIGRIVPTFQGILAHWDGLVRIYERDLAAGRSDELYRRIKELRGDCPDHPVLQKAA